MGKPKIGFVRGDCTNMRFVSCRVIGEHEICFVPCDWTSLRLVSCHAKLMRFQFSVVEIM
ncbi:PREDICTED: LOW QUALITY PROTEIN: uncharacterized protein LOC109125470 [Camelina sativa]|uniref:LOW QUALITY PROTEIN: uncharacterized protein LOC109125470 n=1 Tax=Camelina sativa TaxID=90675 RepID=A0ABM1Q7A7_CAMSA|nr:PREDICTED: LOW QUALITY PROTEIN: uncharacterized protein LOC109125470 [Camelina sativa]